MAQAQLIEYLKNNTVDKMTSYLISDTGTDLLSAIDFIYNSNTYRLLFEDDTDLYAQSPAYVYELLKSEYQTGHIV